MPTWETRLKHDNWLLSICSWSPFDSSRSARTRRLVSKLNKFQSSVIRAHAGQEVPRGRPPRAHELAFAGGLFHLPDTRGPLPFSREHGDANAEQMRASEEGNGGKVKVYAPE